MADWGRTWANKTWFDPAALSTDHQDAVASPAPPWARTRELSGYLVHGKPHGAAAPPPQSPSLGVGDGCGTGEGAHKLHKVN